MEIKDFIIDDKLVIPEEEIDNIYIWTKVSSTQDMLMSSKLYYSWMKKSFEVDTARYINVLKETYSSIERSNYTLSDFITFSANDLLIYPHKKSCFVYCRDAGLLKSLICYTAHTRNTFFVKEVALSEIIFDRIDEPDKVKALLNTEMLELMATGLLPEHKLKKVYINSIISQRMSQGFYTFVYTFNASKELFDDDKLIEERAISKGAKNLNPLIKPWNDRRTYDYRKLMSTWYSMLADTSSLIYSKTEPQDKVRQRERYER